MDQARLHGHPRPSRFCYFYGQPRARLSLEIRRLRNKSLGGVSRMFNAFRRLNKLFVPTSFFSRFSSRTLPLTFTFVADNMADVLKTGSFGIQDHPRKLVKVIQHGTAGFRTKYDIPIFIPCIFKIKCGSVLRQECVTHGC